MISSVDWLRVEPGRAVAIGEELNPILIRQGTLHVEGLQGS
jgi:hypothetical protein